MVVLIRAPPRGSAFSLFPRKPRGGEKNQICEPSVFLFSARYLQLSSITCKLFLVSTSIFRSVNVYVSLCYLHLEQYTCYFLVISHCKCECYARIFECPGQNTFFCPGVRGGRIKVSIVIGVAREIILADLSLGLFAITGGSG